MAFADTQKLVVELDLKGNLNQKLGDAARAIKGFDRATSNTQQSLSKFGRNLQRGIVLGAAAAAGGFVAVAKAAGDFEAQMNTIATIVDRKDIAKIGADLRKTARDTGISLDDLTTAYYDLASAGVKGQLATDALNDAVKLGIGGLATTAETVDLLTTAINAYKLDSAGAAKATDQFALAVQDGKIKASEIAASFADVASIAKTYKIGIDQIAASYAVLTAQGVPASEVTTEMQRAIISLINPTKDLEEAQKKLGISFTKEIASKGLVGALQELRVYSDKTGIPLIALLGRIEAVKYTLQTTGPNLKTYNAELAKMGKASGTAAAQMAERQQGLNFQLARLKALAKDAGITIGSALLPKLTPLVEKLNTFISANQSKIADFGTKLADGFTKLADAIGKVDWQPFIDGLKLSGDIAKTVISAFRSLPEDLQKLVIAGFALNKVTGGLGTSLIKDIGGAALNQFASRGSSPINPLFVTQVGGIPGLGGGESPGGLLGVIKSAAKWIVPLAVGIATVELLQELNKDPAGVARPAPPPTFGRFGATKPGGFGTGTGNSLEDRDLRDIANFTSGTENNVGKMADDIGPLAGSLRDLRSSFHSDLWTLIHATKALDVQKAARKIGAEISKGIGNAANTEKSLGALKHQLTQTDDPKTRAVLKAQIARVERVLPDRKFAAQEYRAVNGILRDGKITAGESKQLHRIMAAVKDRGLPAVTRGITAKVEAAKKAQVSATAAVKLAVAAVKSATDRSTQATKDQDLSVVLNNTVNAYFTARDVNKTTKRTRSFGRIPT